MIHQSSTSFYHRDCCVLGTHILRVQSTDTTTPFKAIIFFRSTRALSLCVQCMANGGLAVLVLWTQENECNKPASKWWWLACMQQPRPAFNLYRLQQAFCRGSPPRGYYALEGGHAWPSTVSCLVNFFWWFV